MRMREFLAGVGYKTKKLTTSEVQLKRGSSLNSKTGPRGIASEILATIHSSGKNRAVISLALNTSISQFNYDLFLKYLEAEIAELKNACQTGKIDTTALDKRH